MDAVLHKQQDAVRLLLERGARTTITNHWQQTALQLAQDDNLHEIARLIEERIAIVAEGVHGAALVAAAKSGDRAEVEKLIAAGANVNERLPINGSVDDDYTPLGIAVREGHIDIVRLLLSAGADPRRVIGLMRGTVVHEAAFFGNSRMIEALLARDGSVPRPELDAQGPYNGLTALHDAVWHGHLDAARALVRAGARLDLQTHTGLTPRQLALLYGYGDIVSFFDEAEGS
jgi:uncharacterized protein